MQIDWLTVAAQIVNFLVLVWLLQRFLYKPITDAMRRREDRIEERLAEAKAARKEAEDEASALEHEKDELEASKEEIMRSAREEADKLRERMEAEIRDDMEDKRAAWQEHLAEEREAFVATLRRQAGRQVLNVTERVLSDYADGDIAERVVTTFVERLKDLDADTREKMTSAAQGSQPALVHTGSRLESAAKSKITKAIHKHLATDIDVDYREDDDMVFGVRLTIGDYTVEWSAMRYLQRLETELDEIIDVTTRRQADSKDAAATGDAKTQGTEENRDATEEDHETA